MEYSLPTPALTPSPSFKANYLNSHEYFGAEIDELSTTSSTPSESSSTLPLVPNLSASNAKKRKTVQPCQSLSTQLTQDEKFEQRIFKLDVFAVFANRPKVLLFNKKKLNSRNLLAATAGGTKKRQVEKVALSIDTSRARLARIANKGRSSSFSCKSSGSDGGDNGDKGIAKPLPSFFSDPEIAALVDLKLFNDTKKSSPVIWKVGHPLVIDESFEGFSDLTAEEIRVCSTLRLLPSQYSYIKEILLRACIRGPYKKRDAQGWFRIDVNKTNKVYDWFVSINWIPSFSETWFDDVLTRFSKPDCPNPELKKKLEAQC